MQSSMGIFFPPHFQHSCLLCICCEHLLYHAILLWVSALLFILGNAEWHGYLLFSSSNTGVVNIYDKDTCMASQSPMPEKAIMNLTTSCTGAVFNSCTEVLALASNLNEKSIKLVRTAGQLNRGCRLLGLFNAKFSLERYWWGPRSQEVEGWVGYT